MDFGRLSPAVIGLVFAAIVAGAASSSAVAQEAPVRVDVLPRHLQARIAVDESELERADDTRRQFRQLLERYPPSLGRILKLDPALMTNGVYLQPYPALAAFLEAHPEIARDPAYFLEFVYDQAEPVSADVEARRAAINLFRDIYTTGMAFAAFGAAVLSLGWLIRYIVGHRRWLRTARLHSDIHGRLLERFTSNEELLAYIQSPAGRQLLQGMPAAADLSPAPAVAAPVNRILWSVQSGLVLGCAGIGLLVIRQYLVPEVAEVLLVFGVLALSVGLGFALAAGASYIVSHRLGLLDGTGINTSRQA